MSTPVNIIVTFNEDKKTFAMEASGGDHVSECILALMVEAARKLVELGAKREQLCEILMNPPKHQDLVTNQKASEA